MSNLVHDARMERETRLLGPSSCLTSRELAVFLKAVFAGRVFKNKATLALMRANPPSGVAALGPGTFYGHGMSNINGVLGHGGQTLGFNSDGGYLREKGITVVIWANSASSGVDRLVVPKIAEIITDIRSDE